MKAIERIKFTLRIKHKSGHRIHSPYVFTLVRALFMKNVHYEYPHSLEMYNTLCELGLKDHFAYRAAQFFSYNSFNTFGVNISEYNGEDMIIVSSIDDSNKLNLIIEQMRVENKRSAILVLNIYRNKSCREWWKQQNELALDVYRMGIIILDKDLNKEYFKLKI